MHELQVLQGNINLVFFSQWFGALLEQRRVVEQPLCRHDTIGSCEEKILLHILMGNHIPIRDNGYIISGSD